MLREVGRGSLEIIEARLKNRGADSGGGNVLYMRAVVYFFSTWWFGSAHRRKKQQKLVWLCKIRVIILRGLFPRPNGGKAKGLAIIGSCSKK